MRWNVKNTFEDQLRVAGAQSSDYVGANRRAVNLVPLPVAADGHEIAQTHTVRYHHLLISIEGNRRTCCLKIISPSKKSRSAILIFRGRVIGCLYGRKNLGFQVMQQDATMNALADLAAPGNLLDAYQLPEDLVLSAAALFHGQSLEFSKTADAQEVLASAVEQIANFSLPGCVVVSTAEGEMVCQLYMSEGRIIGLYSSKDGWVEPKLQIAQRYLSSVTDARVMASVLAIRNMDDVAALGFSLTGLADRSFELACERQSDAWPASDGPSKPQYTTAGTTFANYSQRKCLPQTNVVELRKPVPADIYKQYPNLRRLHSSSAIRHGHAICP